MMLTMHTMVVMMIMRDVYVLSKTFFNDAQKPRTRRPAHSPALVRNCDSAYDDGLMINDDTGDDVKEDA